MKSLRSQVFAEYDANNEITHSELCELFSNASIKSIREYLSVARSPKRRIGNTSLKKVNLDGIEPLIVLALNKNPNSNNIKLALDFIKLKQSSEGLEDDIDIEKYLKKVNQIISPTKSVTNANKQ